MWLPPACRENDGIFKAMLARCNFVGSNRPALQDAAKEVSRSMAAPHCKDLDKVVRIAKYLNGEHRRLGEQFLVSEQMMESPMRFRILTGPGA